MHPQDFPILAFCRDEGDDVLLDYELTDKEKAVFHEMDDATLHTSENSDLECYYKIIIPIGKKHGLDDGQAVAFWTRATLSCFEP